MSEDDGNRQEGSIIQILDNTIAPSEIVNPEVLQLPGSGSDEVSTFALQNQTIQTLSSPDDADSDGVGNDAVPSASTEEGSKVLGSAVKRKGKVFVPAPARGATYWFNREKNTFAAKKSREKRRKKEADEAKRLLDEKAGFLKRIQDLENRLAKCTCGLSGET